MVEVALQVVGELLHGAVACRRSRRGRAPEDGIQITLQRTQESQRRRPSRGGHSRRQVRSRRVDGCGRRAIAAAGEQFREQDSQRPDVSPLVDDVVGAPQLFWRGVAWRAHGLRRSGQRIRSRGRERQAEVDDLGACLTVDLADQHVARLQVAVDDALAVGVVHAGADAQQDADPFGNAQAPAIAERRDRFARDMLHGEPDSAIVGRAGLQEGGDPRMAQGGQRLAFAFEPLQQIPGVTTGSDHLDSDPMHDRIALLGEEDLPHAAAAEFAEQVIRADPVDGIRCGRVRVCGGVGQQCLDLAPQGGVPGALRIQPIVASVGWEILKDGEQGRRSSVAVRCG